MYMANEKEVISPKKERFRNFTIKFNEPLSNLILSSLPEKIDFISKYRDFNVIKINENVVGMIFKDSLDIFYNLNGEELKANSPIRSDEKVIERLKETADRILKIYGIGEKQYILYEGVDFQFLENYGLQNKLDSKLIKNFQTSFEKEGTIALADCAFIIKTKDKDELIRLTYPTPEDLSKNRLLVECDKNYLKKVIEVLSK